LREGFIVCPGHWGNSRVSAGNSPDIPPKRGLAIKSIQNVPGYAFVELFLCGHLRPQRVGPRIQAPTSLGKPQGSPLGPSVSKAWKNELCHLHVHPHRPPFSLVLLPRRSANRPLNFVIVCLVTFCSGTSSSSSTSRISVLYRYQRSSLRRRMFCDCCSLIWRRK